MTEKGEHYQRHRIAGWDREGQHYIPVMPLPGASSSWVGLTTTTDHYSCVVIRSRESAMQAPVSAL